MIYHQLNHLGDRTILKIQNSFIKF